MMGFNGKGMPQEFAGDFLMTCKEQAIPYSKGQLTYKDALIEAFPDKSLSEINRLFRDHAVRVYGFEALADENPAELFGGSFECAVFRAGKTRGVLFR